MKYRKDFNLFNFVLIVLFHPGIISAAEIARTPAKLIPCNSTKFVDESDVILIQSPGYGYDYGYPKSLTCNWNIKSKSDTCKLQIWCPKFRLSDLICQDYLEIQYSDGLHRRHCGIKGLQSSNLEYGANLVFKSNNFPKLPYTGFRCRIECNKSASGIIALEKPKMDENCECGKPLNSRESKIINGSAAMSTEFSWMAALTTVRNEQAFCGGAVISPRYILTAAHCVERMKVDYLKINLNYDYEKYSKRGGAVDPDEHNVQEIILHPKYDSFSLDYDVALVKVTAPMFVPGKLSAMPICLPDKGEDFVNRYATVSGYGNTGRVFTGELQKVNVTVWPEPQCSNIYKDRKINPDKLCAYAPHQDACYGDSGGPLMVKSGMSRYVHIGLVSSGGRGCAQIGKPGVYIKTTEILPWIWRTVRNDGICTKP